MATLNSAAIQSSVPHDWCSKTLKTIVLRNIFVKKKKSDSLMNRKFKRTAFIGKLKSIM